MHHLVRTLGATLLLSLPPLTRAQAQSPSERGEALRDSLERQQETFIQTQLTQRSYGIEEIDRPFRHERIPPSRRS